MKLREWQQKAFPLWWAKKKGIVKVVTGGGKTFFAIHCLKKYLEEIRGDQSAAPVTDQSTQQTSIQTPPLPASGQPIVRTAAANVNPNTNLTRTQEALLSPDEKVIASRRT